MTPEQIDAVTNAWMWADQQTARYGPGLGLAALCVAISWTCSKTRGWRDKRAARRQLQHEHQQMARLTEAITQAPLIPTQPGQDQQLLDDCRQILHATEDRKKKP